MALYVLFAFLFGQQIVLEMAQYHHQQKGKENVEAKGTQLTL